MTKKRGPGRPPLPPEQHKTKISVWVSKKAAKWLQKMARPGRSQGKLVEMGIDLLRQVLTKKRKGGK